MTKLRITNWRLLNKMSKNLKSLERELYTSELDFLRSVKEGESKAKQDELFRKAQKDRKAFFDYALGEE